MVSAPLTFNALMRPNKPLFMPPPPPPVAGPPPGRRVALNTTHARQAQFGGITLIGSHQTVERALQTLSHSHGIRGLTTRYQQPMYNHQGAMRYATVFLKRPESEPGVISWLQQTNDAHPSRGNGGNWLDAQPSVRTGMPFLKPEPNVAALSVITTSGDSGVSQVWQTLCGLMSPPSSSSSQPGGGASFRQALLQSLDSVTTRWFSKNPLGRQTVISLHPHRQQADHIEQLGRALFSRQTVITLPSYYQPHHYQ